MSDAGRKGFDSSANVAYIHQDKGGRMPPGGDGLEARVKALEDKFDRIDGKLDMLVKDVSYLKGKVDAMPTTLHLLGFAVAVFVAAGIFRFFTA